MEGECYYSGCRIKIDGDAIACSYQAHWGTKNWQLNLGDKEICYTNSENKKSSFAIKDIQEFQFEMSNGGSSRAQQDFPAATAYVILKSNPDPQEFFYFFIDEKYVLLNQTKAYEFCGKMLNHIGERYGIPVAYKLSIDTKKKQRAIALVPLILIITFILIYLRLRSNS